MKSRLLPLAALALLAACSRQEPESVEAQADNLSAQIENRADQIAAEAENGVNATAAELDAEFAGFDNAVDSNDAGNAAGR